MATISAKAKFGALSARGAILAPGSLYARGSFGAMLGFGVLTLARRRFSGQPVIGLPNASPPIVDPETGKMTTTEIQFRTMISADLTKIKAILGIT